MLEIRLEQVSRRFIRQEVIAPLDWQIQAGEKWSILGQNGSGKSTLLQIVSGFLSPSSGAIFWMLDGKPVNPADVYTKISLSGPYMELLEEFTLSEFLDMHFRVKPPVGGLKSPEILEKTRLQAHANKQIRFFSSGMKQRVRLVQAIVADTPLLLLDEPASNMDEAGMDWLDGLLNEFLGNRTLVVASNHHPRETRFCTQSIRL